MANQKRTTTVYCAKVISMLLKSLKSTLRSVWHYWQFWFLKYFNEFSFSTSNVFNAVWFVFILYLFFSFFFLPCIVLVMFSRMRTCPLHTGIYLIGLLLLSVRCFSTKISQSSIDPLQEVWLTGDLINYNDESTIYVWQSNQTEELINCGGL